MIDLNAVYQQSPNIVSRNIAGNVILVPIKQSVGDLNGIFTMNETAAFVWEQLDGQRSLQDILNAVLDEFDVEAAVAESDLRELAEQLAELTAIVQA